MVLVSIYTFVVTWFAQWDTRIHYVSKCAREIFIATQNAKLEVNCSCTEINMSTTVTVTIEIRSCITMNWASKMAQSLAPKGFGIRRDSTLTLLLMIWLLIVI